MNSNIISYKENTGKANLYSELSKEAKEIARDAVLQFESCALQKYIQKAKAKFDKNIHDCVNDINHISRLSGLKRTIDKMKTDTIKLESVIMGNLCHFTNEGKYIVYSAQL